MAGVYEADDLTSADQATPDWLTDWLVSDSICEGAKSVIKSQFSDMELNISDCLLGLSICNSFFFFHFFKAIYVLYSQ